MHSKLTKFYFNALLILAMMLCVSCLKAQKLVKQKPVFMIVHGAWGGSWAFRKVDSLMTERHVIVYRPSLTGLGERVHLADEGVTLTTHIHDVVNTILFEDLRNVILVGHSYGGMVITGVADAVPDRIAGLIYLDAMVPEDGENVMQIMDPKGEGISKMVQGGYLVPAWAKTDQKPPKDVPHPLKTFTERIVLKNADAKQISATYILTVDPGKKAEDDNFAGSAARARQRGWKVLEMRADHNPQWSAVDDLASMLLSLK
jgi:pimeloyl-ACP methyl ester carboxylesterase